MKHIKFVFVLLLLLAAYHVSHAQSDYCDTVAIRHGHGPITVTGIAVDDPEIFRAELLRSAPFELGEGEEFGVRLCILRSDGKTYRTRIRYQTSHGEFAVDASMTAPDLTSSIVATDSPQRPRVLVYPAPPHDWISVLFSRTEPVPIVLRLYDARGALARSMVLRGAPAPLRPIQFDVRGLCTGVYRLSVEIGGTIAAVYPVHIIR